MFVRDHDGNGGAATVAAKPDALANAGPASWTVLAYMAGDNDLEGSLLGDLREMERVGSRPGSVEIVAQIDRAPGYDTSRGDWTGSRRYYVTKASSPGKTDSKLLADLGETNTGDPRVLKDFIAFGVRRFPARATMLVLSNHGSGFYVPPEMVSRQSGRQRRFAHTARAVRRSLFHTTREWLLAPEPHRGIAYDDGSGDCLDNRELKQVVADAHRILGHPVDVLGMDACLMTMLEVAYQLRDHVRILVGSEEVEPGDGWPYAAVFGDLTARPAMTPSELATTIVHRYAEYYDGGPDATQSAIDLAKLDDLVRAVDALARALLGALPSASVELTLYTAWRRSLRFLDGLYVDLRHFAHNLGGASTRSDVRRGCVEVQRAIEAGHGPIIAERHGGPRMAPASGLSIYFPPFRDPSAFYRDLDFARRTRWADFLDAYFGKGRAGAAR